MSARDNINNRWDLDCERNKVALHAALSDREKKRFAFRVWREDSEKFLKREDLKKIEIKDTWNEIYQLIGFDNVFQGVWFQGVSGLAAQRGCSFSIIPITLSLLVSVATIVAVNVKFSKVRKLQVAQYEDRLTSKVRESYISECATHGLNFNFNTIEDKAKKPVAVLRATFVAALVRAHSIRVILLAALTIASALFAWLIHLIMCGKYY